MIAAASDVSQPAVLPFGFCLGTAPQKWLERWQHAGYDTPLAAQQLDFAFFPVVDPPAAASTAAAAFHDLLRSGGVCLVRTVDGAKPTECAAGALHSVLLYEEQLSVLVAQQSDAAQLRQLRDLEEFELLQLFDHPWHLPSYPVAQPWLDAAWLPTSVGAVVELAATGTAGALLPLPLARQLAQKKEHRVLPVAVELVAPQPAVWACWLRSSDSAAVQDLIGVLRGRKSGSSRDASAAANQTQVRAKRTARQQTPDRTARQQTPSRSNHKNTGRRGSTAGRKPGGAKTRRR